MKIVLSNQAKFDPYTFDELLKVPAMYTAEYNAIEDQYNDTLSKLQAYKKYADDNPESEWARKYNNYVKSGESAVDDMATNRLSAKSRSDLKKYLRDYNAITVPIEEGIKTYKEQEAVRSANPNRLYKKALTFDDAMSGNIDNSFTTEEDIAKDAAETVFNTSLERYRNALAQGKDPNEALTIALHDSSIEPSIQALKANYNNAYTNSNYSDIITNAINKGKKAAVSKLLDANTMTVKELEDKKFRESQAKKQDARWNTERLWKQAELESQGYEYVRENGKLVKKVNPDSEYWKQNGIYFDDEGRMSREGADGLVYKKSLTGWDVYQKETDANGNEVERLIVTLDSKGNISKESKLAEQAQKLEANTVEKSKLKGISVIATTTKDRGDNKKWQHLVEGDDVTWKWPLSNWGSLSGDPMVDWWGDVEITKGDGEDDTEGIFALGDKNYYLITREDFLSDAGIIDVLNNGPKAKDDKYSAKIDVDKKAKNEADDLDQYYILQQYTSDPEDVKYILVPKYMFVGKEARLQELKNNESNIGL